MNIVVGGFYTIKDEFFEMVNDPHLYRNHPNGRYRPHFLAIYDKDTDLYWMVPCTTKVDKYQHHFNVYKSRLKNARTQKEANRIKKQILGFTFMSIAGKQSVIVFADMFPICSKFIDHPFYIGKKPYMISQSANLRIINQANKVKNMLEKGFVFQKGQPNISRIKIICLAYNSK